MLEEKGYLFHNDFIIFDEAHTLESGGGAASRAGNFARQGCATCSSGFFIRARRRASSRRCTSGEGDEARARGGGGMRHLLRPARALARFKRAKELRLREPGIAANSLDLPLARLYRNLADAAREVEDEVFKAEVQEAARRVEGLRVGLGEFISQSREDHVYWIERNERKDTHLTLTAAPIDVASQLAPLIFRPKTPRS
jgi:ATP-dependent DNA helicase DinG